MDGKQRDQKAWGNQERLCQQTVSNRCSHRLGRKGSAEHHQLEDKYGFAYRTLLGELMYAYVTCRPDIGYAVITLSKFSTCPSDYHFAMLKKVVRYLRQTRKWGIIYHKPTEDPTLPQRNKEVINVEKGVTAVPRDGRRGSTHGIYGCRAWNRFEEETVY